MNVKQAMNLATVAATTVFASEAARSHSGGAVGTIMGLVAEVGGGMFGAWLGLKLTR